MLTKYRVQLARTRTVRYNKYDRYKVLYSTVRTARGAGARRVALSVFPSKSGSHKRRIMLV